MGRFVVGKSTCRRCGAYVIVGEDALDWLEGEAKTAKLVFVRARRARTPAEMRATLRDLPVVFRFGVDARVLDAHDASLDWDALEEVSASEAMWRACVERAFPAGADLDRPAVRDTEACFDAMAGIDAVAPYLKCASRELGAGFDDVDAAVAALEGAGHRCVRDDERLARVFGVLVTPRYVVGQLSTTRAS